MTFYFYDLETSGFSGRDDRIMQFAGQRTDMELNPVGEPDNLLVKMTADVLPQPDAVLVHGITPQKTLEEGISEFDFCKYLTSQVSTADTVLVGYNNVRFDNEFIRFTLWRNFHDAYEWSWKENCSIWDLLDVVRMTRALRPAGIKWPFSPDGRPSNKLEYLSAVNGLDHTDAHDALSDVRASIAVARLLKTKQPAIFNYLFEHRNKKQVAPLAASGRAIVYTSGRYPDEYNKTAVVVSVAEKPDKSGALMYDLRVDPDEFTALPATELARRWKARGDDVPYFPVKELKYNKCPAIAPLEVLEKDGGYENLQLHKEIVQNHMQKLLKANDFGGKLLEALEIMWPKRQTGLVNDPQTVDNQLYDGFVTDDDKTKMSAVRAARPDGLSNLELNFKDERLALLLPIYKARNFAANLSGPELKQWEEFRKTKLLSGGLSSRAALFRDRLNELAATPGLSAEKQLLLKQLGLYAQKIIPASSTGGAYDSDVRPGAFLEQEQNA